MSGEEVGGESVKGRPGLSGFILKILACLTMTADHIGAILFPGVIVLRAIGRVSFPLFAFLSAEGSRYSRRPVIRFLTIAALGLVCEIVYDVFRALVRQYPAVAGGVRGTEHTDERGENRGGGR